MEHPTPDARSETVARAWQLGFAVSLAGCVASPPPTSGPPAAPPAERVQQAMEQPPAAWQVAPVRKIPLGPQHVERDEEGLLISASVASTVGVELRASILPSGAEAFTGQTAEFTLIHLDVDGETAAVAEELVTPGCETPSSQARFTWEELEVSAVPAFSVVRLVCSTKADDEPGWWVGEQTWLLQGGALVWKGHEVVLASDPEPWSWGECRTTRFEWRNRAGELEVRAQTFPEPDGGYGC